MQRALPRLRDAGISLVPDDISRGIRGNGVYGSDRVPPTWFFISDAAGCWLLDPAAIQWSADPIQRGITLCYADTRRQICLKLRRSPASYERHRPGRLNCSCFHVLLLRGGGRAGEASSRLTEAVSPRRAVRLAMSHAEPPARRLVCATVQPTFGADASRVAAVRRREASRQRGQRAERGRGTGHGGGSGQMQWNTPVPWPGVA
jgi:hypothetical protein